MRRCGRCLPDCPGNAAGGGGTARSPRGRHSMATPVRTMMVSLSPTQVFGSPRTLGLATSGAPIRCTFLSFPWLSTIETRSVSVTASTEETGPRCRHSGGRQRSQRRNRAPTTPGLLPDPPGRPRPGLPCSDGRRSPPGPAAGRQDLGGAAPGVDQLLVDQLLPPVRACRSSSIRKEADTPSTRRSRRSSANGSTGVASRCRVKTLSTEVPGTLPSGVTTCTSATQASAPATWRVIQPSSDLASQWATRRATTGRRSERCRAGRRTRGWPARVVRACRAHRIGAPSR